MLGFLSKEISGGKMIAKRTLTFSVSLVSALTVILSSTPALAAVPANCISSTYSCTSLGYAGYDPYGYWRFAALDADGRRHNCTSYAAYAMSELGPWNANYGKLGNASDWAERAATYGLRVSAIPTRYSIAQWNVDNHVGLVESVVYNASGTLSYIVVSSDNWGRLVTTRVVYYRWSDGFPDNFIAFPLNGGGGVRPPIPMIAPLSVTE
jgi:hypothetical protein